jgi:hypothetical protein
MHVPTSSRSKAPPTGLKASTTNGTTKRSVAIPSKQVEFVLCKKERVRKIGDAKHLIPYKFNNIDLLREALGDDRVPDAERAGVNMSLAHIGDAVQTLLLSETIYWGIDLSARKRSRRPIAHEIVNASQTSCKTKSRKSLGRMIT